jgi:ABC-type transporter Mla MlaB component
MPQASAANGGSARWQAPERIDHTNAMVLIREASTALRDGGTIDLGRVQSCDSSAVGVLLALKRLTQAPNKPLQIMAMPACIAALIELYELEAVLS